MFTGNFLTSINPSARWPDLRRPYIPSRADFRQVTIGRSGEGRPLTATQIGSPESPVRILVMAGQHGDERTAMASVRRLEAACRDHWAVDGNLQIALLAEANPDGAFRKTRAIAGGIDLNRDHQLLRAPETIALHRFIRTWRPHLVVDVHNYPSRRKHLLRQNLVYCQDLFVDIPTNPNCADGPLGRLTRELLQTVVSTVRRNGYRSDRYTLINGSGRVRHSTPDVNDARNGLALRYGIPTLLFEVRQPNRRDNPAARERLRTVLHAAVTAIFTWAGANHEKLTAAEIPIPLAVLRSRYKSEGRRCALNFKIQPSGDIQRVILPGKYTPNLKTTLEVDLPRAYAVPTALPGLCEILIRHGFTHHRVDQAKQVRIQSYRLHTVSPSRRPRRMPRRLSLERLEEVRSLEDYIIFPTSPGPGNALAVFLEPQSKYGLYRFSETGLKLASGVVYPVLRVGPELPLRVSWQDPAF